jgi:hypothetical protein
MKTTTAMNSGATIAQQRHLFILADDWTWWAWLFTAILLAIGLAGYPSAFIVAMAVTTVQAIMMLIREKSISAFPVQLRIAYLLLLTISFIPQMRWLYWLPTLGTFALVIFGYCLLARALFLLPWNRQESLSADLLRRTFMTRPDLSRVAGNPHTAGCAGGLCTIEAQVGRKAT